jgi:hypothetical protein
MPTRLTYIVLRSSSEPLPPYFVSVANGFCIGQGFMESSQAYGQNMVQIAGPCLVASSGEPPVRHVKNHSCLRSGPRRLKARPAHETRKQWPPFQFSGYVDSPLLGARCKLEIQGHDAHVRLTADYTVSTRRNVIRMCRSEFPLFVQVTAIPRCAPSQPAAAGAAGRHESGSALPSRLWGPHRHRLWENSW